MKWGRKQPLAHIGPRRLEQRLLTRSGILTSCFVLLFAGLAASFLPSSRADPLAPATPPAQICSNSTILGAGPSSAPVGATTVSAGDNSGVTFNQTSKTYWFAAGTHTLGTGQFNQIQPANNSTYIGAPGAIIDGQGDNSYAFTGTATGVTVEYLTIQNFGQGSSSTTPSSDDNNQGVVNHDAGHNWTIKYNTVQYDAGAGVFVGTGDDIEYNCLTQNGQYGFSAYEVNDVSNVVVSNNEISYNDTYNWEAHIDGCGCTGGGKFWRTHGATFNDNYVHDNHSVGMWADTDNNAFDVEGNYFSNNWGEGIIYEISYNALIKNNTFISNAIGTGEADPGFPHPAIYLSESGSDSRVSGAYGTELDVTGNVFTNNWNGVILWENANRFCASPDNSSSGDCTSVNPSVANLTNCGNHSLIGTTPYINDCRWKTQNVQVTDNTFNMTPSAIGASCTKANSCGFNGIFSEYGTDPSWSPYMADYVEDNIMYHQNNQFANNTYTGTWNFMAHEQGTEVSFAQWQASPYTQDTGSTLNAVADTTPPSTPSGVSATALSSTSVRVTWNASTDTGGSVLGGYYVYRDGTQVGSVNSTTTQYTDSTAQAGTTYGYTVKAYDGAANLSAGSSSSSVTTPAAASAPAVALSVSAGTQMHGPTQTLTATVTPSSGRTVTQAQLIINSVVVQTITTSPYTFSFSTLPYADGNLTVSVKAIDSSSLVTTQPVTIVVTNGDFNGDSEVNITDLSVMAGHWNVQSGATYNQGDINGDGKVTISDLSALASNWNKTW